MTVPLVLRECDHARSLNPRHADTCVKCGRKLPEGPKPARRDIELEREVTREAARGYVDPSRLIEHAEARASALSGEYVSDPMLIQPGRDRRRDVREEIADARNHAVWWLAANVGDERQEAVLEGLAWLCAAYDKFCDEV